MKNNTNPGTPVVIITGASSGIGETAAITLANKGYRVVIAARRKDRLEEIAEQIRKTGGEVLPLQLDLSQVGQIRDLVERTRNVFGRIDVLVNNAGSAHHLWLDEQSLEEDIQTQLQVNLIGMIQLTRLVIPEMVASGSGQIIHISSIASWVGVPTYTIYNASKFGSRGFMSSLRRELRGTGVTISEIFPGAVDTEFGQDPDVSWKTTTVTPKLALLSPQSVADQILEMILRKKTRSVIPGFMWLAIWADAHFPGVVGWILSKYFYSSNGVRYSWRQRKE
ncbi:MAG: SDR family NAD(P)-dependent oxidoreductase [Anaerolineales bacterium]|nr:SDR family NAD(P)-dependent oxidoreductase [Anaerolineales bacterium]